MHPKTSEWNEIVFVLGCRRIGMERPFTVALPVLLPRELE